MFVISEAEAKAIRATYKQRALYENWSDAIERILRVMKRDDPVSARVFSLIDLFRQSFNAERYHAILELARIGPAVLSAITPGDCWSADVMATILDVEGGEARCVARIADRQRSRSGLSAPRKAIAGSVVWIARSSSTNGAVAC
jgi:hypothetical protein